jgi:hypothetical protein
VGGWVWNTDWEWLWMSGPWCGGVYGLPLLRVLCLRCRFPAVPHTPNTPATHTRVCPSSPPPPPHTQNVKYVHALFPRYFRWGGPTLGLKSLNTPASYPVKQTYRAAVQPTGKEEGEGRLRGGAGDWIGGGGEECFEYWAPAGGTQNRPG